MNAPPRNHPQPGQPGLLDVLAGDASPDAVAHVAGCAIAVLPQLPAGEAAVAGSEHRLASLRRQLARPLLAAARLVLRRPQARQFALRVLKRFPGLYARAYRMMMQSGSGVAQAGPGRDAAAPATLSARGAAIYRSLRRLGAAPASAPISPARRKLAFVSPLPPERTGIATYAVDVLAELRAHFDIELIVAQPETCLPPALSGLPVRESAWFAEHGDAYDQVLYQFGNSPFHSHMFALLRRYPGVVVLHDFYLGGALVHAQASGALPQAWTEALLHSHGYAAVRASERADGKGQAHKAWPASLGVLEAATGVIVHSQHARQLAADWYGAQAARHIDVVPLPRTAPPARDRAAARAALGIASDTFLVCSFGFVAPNKLTHELLRAWLASSLGSERGCMLVLVGANHDSPYGVQVDEIIRGAGPDANIRIAGWTDETIYRQYLQAADVGVQLRTNAHGESSAAVLDCLNYGLPTIVNANGSMAEFPADALWRLPDEFGSAELGAALERLRGDAALRRDLGARAMELIEAHFRPVHCAQLYRATLDRAHAAGQARQDAWRAALARAVPAGQPATPETLCRLAGQLAHQPAPLAPRRLLVDVSAWAHRGLPAGDTRRLLLALLSDARAPLRVEPVYLRRENGAVVCRHARNATGRLLGLGWGQQDEPVAEIGAGDVFFAPEALSPAILDAGEAGVMAGWRACGVTITLYLASMPAGPALQPLRRLAADADRLLCASEAQAQQLAREIA